MGKNKKGQPSNSNLGRALIKGRRQNNRASRSNDAASWVRRLFEIPPKRKKCGLLCLTLVDFF